MTGCPASHRKWPAGHPLLKGARSTQRRSHCVTFSLRTAKKLG